MSIRANMRVGAAVAVMIAYVIGIAIGNLLWLPYTKGLAVALAMGGFVICSPLLAAAGIVALIAEPRIRARPAIWSIAAALAVVSVYAVFDRPINSAALERLALASTCAAISALTFYWIRLRFAGSKSEPDGL